ncbi:uncharacterized protein LOC111700497 [Eurytemora carolleeae]|uniref:uncharacterized protein LOC111700497 n=1 Tax=Eurytemora carolleeae TaxID=1294199 RepID=UPI000C760D28|nr:uncharacterized protein LOC111700497 [Eurytemora carolleeae]|eukprot:XP_023327195.1 uncharacterized protein LOC111700497 [Eurytemora affinis]
MDQQRLERDFSQLKFPVFDWTRATNWSQPSADLAHSAVDRQRRFSDRLRPYSMEGLVQDFNTALDETAGSNSSGRSTGRRKTWKRRCKSTSNLLQLSEDSSSSLDNHGLLSRDRGTSSLQLSDSDLESGNLTLGRRNKLGRIQDTRRKGTLEAFGLESDSFTENISPFKEFRVNSKRKRKSKRMAVDPSPESIKPLIQSSFVFRSPGQGFKRKKVRSRSGCDSTTQKKVGITSGKRKRSAREKSADYQLADNQPKEKEVEGMDTEDIRSYSSMSSSEWEDQASDSSPGERDGVEADDEQSDWPGPEPGISVMHLTDEDTDPDISFNLQLPRIRGRQNSSREIKAGTRRLRAHKIPCSQEQTKRLSHAEIVTRFLQDSSASSIRVAMYRPSDRTLILNLASLYTLSWIQEDTSILLTKNCRQPAVEFAIPGIPKSKVDRKKFEPKRQKRTQPCIQGGSDSRMEFEPTKGQELTRAADLTTPELVYTRQRCKSGSKSS